MREKPKARRRSKQAERPAAGSPAAPLLFHAEPGLDLEIVFPEDLSALTEMFHRTVRTSARNAWNALGEAQRAGLLSVEAHSGYARANIPEDVEDCIETEVGRHVAGVIRGESWAGESFACGECSFRASFRAAPAAVRTGEGRFLWETLAPARAVVSQVPAGASGVEAAGGLRKLIARFAWRLWLQLANAPRAVHNDTRKGANRPGGEEGVSGIEEEKLAGAQSAFGGLVEEIAADRERHAARLASALNEYLLRWAEHQRRLNEARGDRTPEGAFRAKHDLAEYVSKQISRLHLAICYDDQPTDLMANAGKSSNRWGYFLLMPKGSKKPLITRADLYDLLEAAGGGAGGSPGLELLEAPQRREGLSEWRQRVRDRPDSPGPGPNR